MSETLGESRIQDLIVRDARGNKVERDHVRWWWRNELGITKTRGLQIGDQVEDAISGRVIVRATAETVAAL